MFHGMLHDNKYMSLVEVDIPLHNILVVGSCGTPLGLCLIQILFYLILHLYIQPDLLEVHCTEVPIYTAWGYNVAAHCCIADAHCYTVATHFCMEVVPG